MKNAIKSLVSIAVVLTFGFSFELNKLKPVYTSYSGYNDNDYFSANIIASGGSSVGFCFPVEIFELYEERGLIVVKTREKSFVKCPVKAKVSQYSNYGMQGCWFKILNYSVFMLGFEVVNAGTNSAFKCGQIVGSLDGDKLYLKVFNKDKKVPLSTIRKLLNV